MVANIRDSFNNVLILFSLASIPTTQFFVNDLEASANNLTLCNTFLMMTGLNTFSSNWPLEPAMETVVLFPIT